MRAKLMKQRSKLSLLGGGSQEDLSHYDSAEEEDEEEDDDMHMEDLDLDDPYDPVVAPKPHPEWEKAAPMRRQVYAHGEMTQEEREELEAGGEMEADEYAQMEAGLVGAEAFIAHGFREKEGKGVR